ncbi:YbaK / prolyl-tRNA synthetases associated domain containing protein [Neospora caninum Liverpool]|uniref:YbaK / prolyl-tRNA synthetases associated domain containing protein n=1 Tax=Neospora caninum (strain Liverpool) TaxID=572307 RepID=F0VHE2_NEOCL|nr:YbaK / prolyl-tRNA synthetases associated domain containing protein [Neospora caninum Liverpool]CBZ53136.1 YbaK / prolyl-tRNA synthetases associated domain containing protein [Neospora caninum Liverpool]CEL67127.1 TPA: YbaK / prolyl-tRNA synthetases associated domain containing protein, putative [Neospora caninum Liverpool]|eukprot:XP_003883168.1 YbaK / prolyl-tRNA synthetases associated domain containing protein [Neospora caninum Liverpool]
MEGVDGGFSPEGSFAVSAPPQTEKEGTPSTTASQLSVCSPSTFSFCSLCPAMEERMKAFLAKHRVDDFSLVRVASCYYDLTLQQRIDLLKAPSTYHLCKTVVMENTRHTGVDDKLNSKYYMIVVQYQRKVNGERVKDLVKQLNAERGLKLGNKKLNFNFCKTSEELTGFVYNAVTPFASKTDIPVIVDSPILELDPPLVWLGGGEVDLKLRVSVADLLRVFDPLVGSVCFEQEATTNEGN